MSTNPPPPLDTINPPKSTSLSQNIGLGYYSIAIALCFLVLLSSLLLASYVYCRSTAARRRHRRQAQNAGNLNRSNDSIIYLPRILFIEDEGSESENAVVGLDPSVINSYPKFNFSKRNGKLGNDIVCSICLCEYRESEVLRMLPDCRHCFHLMCVDAWLKLNASCPVCRNSPMPTPLSTPLQEVVPLSQYSDGRRSR